MTDLLKEIQEGFANLDESGRMLPIKAMPVECPAWVFREGDIFGVAVECSEPLEISEGFAGAKLRTVERVVAGQHAGGAGEDAGLCAVDASGEDL